MDILWAETALRTAQSGSLECRQSWNLHFPKGNSGKQEPSICGSRAEIILSSRAEKPGVSASHPPSGSGNCSARRMAAPAVFLIDFTGLFHHIRQQSVQQAGFPDA